MVEPGTRVSVHHCGKCSPIALTHLNPPYPDNFNYFKTVDIFKKKKWTFCENFDDKLDNLCVLRVKF